jgi:flagellar biosynthesis/type III secretory pathway M-ring protein FliF/YscJ
MPTTGTGNLTKKSAFKWWYVLIILAIIIFPLIVIFTIYCVFRPRKSTAKPTESMPDVEEVNWEVQEDKTLKEPKESVDNLVMPSNDNQTH